MKCGQEQPPQRRAGRLTQLKLQLVAFDYVDDRDGAKCPFGAHTRRTNPRSALQFGEDQEPPSTRPARSPTAAGSLGAAFPTAPVEDTATDDGDHGVIMMILNADLSRQFEFVQQQWVNFGNDFRLANDQDPILGNHGINQDGRAATGAW